jgi:hypothetical protein
VSQAKPREPWCKIPPAGLYFLSYLLTFWRKKKTWNQDIRLNISKSKTREFHIRKTRLPRNMRIPSHRMEQTPRSEITNCSPIRLSTVICSTMMAFPRRRKLCQSNSITDLSWLFDRDSSRSLTFRFHALDKIFYLCTWNLDIAANTTS